MPGAGDSDRDSLAGVAPRQLGTAQHLVEAMTSGGGDLLQFLGHRLRPVDLRAGFIELPKPSFPRLKAPLDRSRPKAHTPAERSCVWCGRLVGASPAGVFREPTEVRKCHLS